MCGHVTENYTWSDVQALLNVFGAMRNLRPRYDIASTTMIDVVRLDAGGRRALVGLRRGLMPLFWKKSLKDVPAAFSNRVWRDFGLNESGTDDILR